MDKNFHNIIGYFHENTNNLIGYLRDDFSLTDNIYISKKFKLETNLDIIAQSLIDKTYKNWPEYTMSKYEYGHLYLDWFKGLNKEDIIYKIIHYENELRRLKLLKIKNKKR